MFGQNNVNTIFFMKLNFFKTRNLKKLILNRVLLANIVLLIKWIQIKNKHIDCQVVIIVIL